MTEPWQVIDYDPDRWPFGELVADSLVSDEERAAFAGTRGRVTVTLDCLRAELAPRTWQTDQTSPWHPRFYAGFDAWRDTFEAFVRAVVAPTMHEPFAYQAVPTFRVQLPGNTAVGEWHTDATYGHPDGELSHWLPLTAAHDSASVWITGDDGRRQAPDTGPGQVIVFDAVNRVHGNLVNETGRTRVSFDFRTLPVRLLPERPKRTEHTKLPFALGGYYASEPIQAPLCGKPTGHGDCTFPTGHDGGCAVGP